MAVNKVEFGKEALIDLTSDTVTQQSLLKGYSAHNKSGKLIEGVAVVPTKVSELENDENYIKLEEINDLTPDFDKEETRDNIQSGEKISVLFGKVKKWFSDLKKVSFTGKYSDLEGRLTLTNNYLATQPGTAADAMLAKDLKAEVEWIKNKIPEFAIVDTLAPSEANGNTYFDLPDNSWNATNTACLKIMAYNSVTKSWYDNRLYALLVNRLQFTAEAAGQESYYINQPVKVFLIKFK